MEQISISSDAFNDGSTLPVEHACDGVLPCTRMGHRPRRHRYFFKVYALDATLKLKERCHQIPA